MTVAAAAYMATSVIEIHCRRCRNYRSCAVPPAVCSLVGEHVKEVWALLSSILLTSTFETVVSYTTSASGLLQASMLSLIQKEVIKWAASARPTSMSRCVTFTVKIRLW